MAPWIKLLAQGRRQLGGACHAQEHLHTSPPYPHGGTWPLGDGESQLGQQGPYSERGSLSKNILLDDRENKREEGSSLVKVYLPIHFDNSRCRKNESRQKSQVHITGD